MYDGILQDFQYHLRVKDEVVLNSSLDQFTHPWPTCEGLVREVYFLLMWANII